MANDAVVTVRLPGGLKQRLKARATAGHRSLSGQILHDLEQMTEQTPRPPAAGRLIGRFRGTPVPTDADVTAVRRQLWRRLGPARSDD